MIESNEAVAQAAHILRQGGVVVHATEGVWGLACDPGNEAAVQRILDMKGREAAKGFILIAANADEFAQQLALVTPEHAAAVRATWPGAHTWILPNRQYPAYLTGGRTTVACRVPGHAQARALCQAFGGALVSTSANRSGHPAAITQAEAEQAFAEQADLVLDGEVLNAGRPSTIHGLNGEVLR